MMKKTMLMMMTNNELLLPMSAVGNWLLVLVPPVPLALSHLTDIMMIMMKMFVMMTKTVMLIMTIMIIRMATMMIVTTWMRVGWISARLGLGGANTGKVEMVILNGKFTWDFVLYLNHRFFKEIDLGQLDLAL